MIRPNAVVLKSLGKNFGLHGIRFGYLMANPAIAGTVAQALPKWNLNSLAEKVVHMVSGPRRRVRGQPAPAQPATAAHGRRARHGSPG